MSGHCKITATIQLKPYSGPGDTFEWWLRFGSIMKPKKFKSKKWGLERNSLTAKTRFVVEAQESLCWSNNVSTKKLEHNKNFKKLSHCERERNYQGIKTDALNLTYGTPRITTGKQLGENCFNLRSLQELRLTLYSFFKSLFPSDRCIMVDISLPSV